LKAASLSIFAESQCIDFLLPTLDEKTYADLEANLLENGCHDALVLWNGILVDGFNRYKICTEHNIPFRTVNKDFTSRAHVIIWVIFTQISRRNLTSIQLSYYRGRHYREEKQIQGINRQHTEESKKEQNVPFYGSTANRLSDIYNVSSMTIKRDSNLSKAIDAIGESSPEAKQKVLSGEATINKNHLQKLSKCEEENISAIAAEIVEGNFNKKNKATPSTPENTDPSNPTQSDLAQITSLPLKAPLEKATKDFQSDLRKLMTIDDAASLKTTLRAYIDTLETLYKQM